MTEKINHTDIGSDPDKPLDALADLMANQPFIRGLINVKADTNLIHSAAHVVLDQALERMDITSAAVESHSEAIGVAERALDQ